MGDLKEQAAGMKAQWQREKALISDLRKVKEAIDKAKTESELAQRRGDLNKRGRAEVWDLAEPGEAARSRE